jgi:hypothetical protein
MTPPFCAQWSTLTGKLNRRGWMDMALAAEKTSTAVAVFLVLVALL